MKHQDAFQSGAAFPDWGYDCFLNKLDPDRYRQLPDASEGSHWPPFQNVTSQYIHNFTKPWTEEEEKTVVFLLGVICHATADIIWHDLDYVGDYSHEGFIQTLSDMDYLTRGSGYISKAHSEADTGGEFVAAHSESLSFLGDTWFLPSKLLAQIFQAWGFPNVTAEVIQTCDLELYAEVQAIKNLGKIPYREFANRSQFLIEHYHDFFDGGVNDNAFWTSNCWPDIINWMETGKTSSICLVESKWGWTPPNSRNGMDQILELYSLERQKWNSPLYNRLKKEKEAFKASVNFIVKDTELGVVISSERKDGSVPNKKYAGFVSSPEVLACDNLEKNDGDKILISLNNGQFASLGRSIAVGDLNGDNWEDIVISGPEFSFPTVSRTGAAWVLYRTPNTKYTGSISINLDQPPPSNSPFSQVVTLRSIDISQGGGENVRFGEKVVILDFNLDGVDDVVVSIAGSGGTLLTYVGQVNIYFGVKNGFLPPSDAKPDIIIKAPQGLNNTNLGSGLSKGDINGDGKDDLLVGSPYTTTSLGRQTGALWIFVAANTRKTGQVLSTQNSDLSLQGDDMLQLFGASSKVVSYDDRNQLLLVGAPTYNTPKLSALGKLFGFLVPKANISAVSTLFKLSGVNEFEKLSFSFDVGSNVYGGATDRYVAVSSPTQTVNGDHQAGVVSIVSLSSLRGQMNSTQLASLAKTVFNSDEAYSRFGFHLDFHDFDGDSFDDLLLTQPLRTRILPDAADVGRTYLFKGGKNFPTGKVSNPERSSSVCYQSSVHYSWLGFDAKPISFNSVSGSARDLIVSAPYVTQGSNAETGLVAILVSPLK